MINNLKIYKLKNMLNEGKLHQKKKIKYKSEK